VVYNAPMDIHEAERRLYALWGEIRDLSGIQNLLEWDQETQLPERGEAARGEQLSTLAGIKHRLLTAPELVELVERCEREAEPGSVLAAQLRCARLDVDRAVRMPERLVREQAAARSRGLAAWRKAREENDFTLFEPELTRLVELAREEASAVRPAGNAYDTLIHRFEPGVTEAELTPLFARLREELTPMVRAVAESGETLDPAPIQGDFPPERQREFGRRMAVAMGFDFDAGRLDLSTHPFCVGMDPTDVRLTWRYQTDDFRPALLGILHEAGHGLYEQGLPEEHRRTPIGDALSLGIHESQSRLWENHVGRSRGFWRWALPHYRRAFPDAPGVTVDDLWPLLHAVEPSLIRVEADEATYNLHVAVRFEIERALFAGEVEVRDLPALWDDLYDRLLGVRPPDAAQGILQDIHWAQGVFGYFPTYTLGTMIAAQLFAAAERELGELEEAFARGELRPLLDWLRDRIHRHGGRYETPELVTRATGEPLSADPLLAYLRRNVEEVYGVRQ